MTHTYLIPSTTAITQQQVDDLLCAAFEGGITYWCSSADVKGEWPEGATYAHETLTRGATILLTDSESVYESGDGEPVIVALTLDNFLSGISQAAEHCGRSVDQFLEDHDADSADWAVQYAVFGELVYG